MSRPQAATRAQIAAVVVVLVQFTIVAVLFWIAERFR
jgi:hypothetical protein